jgi:hypothetical protein
MGGEEERFQDAEAGLFEKVVDVGAFAVSDGEEALVFESFEGVAEGDAVDGESFGESSFRGEFLTGLEFSGEDEVGELVDDGFGGAGLLDLFDGDGQGCLTNGLDIGWSGHPASRKLS